MPELPEAEYMVRRLRESPGAGLRIHTAHTPDPQLASLLPGRTITGYSRRAKNVLVELSGDYVLRVQLGMTGHFYFWPDPAALPRFTRAHFTLQQGRRNKGCLVFEDARTFGSLEIHPKQNLPSVFSAYGPEPLDPAFTWQALRETAARSQAPLKPFLLDQSRIAGLGNIWAAEALFAARLNPFRRVSSLSPAEWKRLHAAIRQVLSDAIAGTLAVTSKPEEFPDGDLLSCRVYGRPGQPCLRCARDLVRPLIVREVQAGRSTFFCPNCQK
ncbi:MAG: DNA-formamidopyrimidine glycosylase family protein [Bryobacter sp.]|nr:DNA-formamidopyrimidine glycosylase family protein [Bryobacter sp.]